MSENPIKILQNHQLRVTSCRREVLLTFLEKKSALSHSDLEDELKDGFDRVTIYRTLKTFLESDLIHKVLDDSGATKYALCTHDEHGNHSHDHDHVHFKCESCGKTICIEEISLPKITLPKGYINKEANLLVTGICSECN
jgi:Fur family ferric uptake transcriptional regulator